MITQLRHVGVVVKDLKKSLHFYKDLLGLEVRTQTDEENSYIDAILGLQKVRVQTVKLMTPQRGAEIELLYYHSPMSPPRGAYPIHESGLTHFALTIQDLDQEYQRLVGAGVQFLSGVQSSPGGTVKIAFCRDPDGNYIELAQELRK